MCNTSSLKKCIEAMLLIAQIMMILRNENKYAISMGYISLIIRLFRIQYKIPIAEACDYF